MQQPLGKGMGQGIRNHASEIRLQEGVGIPTIKPLADAGGGIGGFDGGDAWPCDDGEAGVDGDRGVMVDEHRCVGA